MGQKGVFVDNKNELEGLRSRIQELEEELERATRAREQWTSMGAGVPSLPEGRASAKAPLSEQEALLATAERSARMGTWVWDLTSNEVRWSPELYHILGYDPDAQLPSIEAFFHRIHPDDVGRVRDISTRTAESGQGAPTECRLLLPTGEQRDVILDGAIRFEGDEPVRVVGTALDVTERRAATRERERSEAFLKEAQRIAKVGSFMWDYASNTMRWSDELYSIMGVEPGEPLTIALVMSLFHKDDQARAVAGAFQVIELGEMNPDDFRIVNRRDGSIRYVHTAAKSRRGAHGEPDSFIGTVLDVTERKQLEEQLRQSQKMEALGRLAGGVAHDFNNLLTVIEGYTQILMRQEPRDELRQIAQASGAAADLTRRLLAFSRQAVIAPVVLDLNAAVESAVKLISRVIGEDIRVTLDLAKDAWNIRADPSQIHQVLLNLALNARDAMPDGGSIVIRTSNVVIGAASDDHVLLEVIDTGVGMDEETKARVFEPFFTTKEPGKGTGFGLATVLAIVRRSGGLIDLTSSPGRGTTFKLTFPRTADPAPEPTQRGSYPTMRGSEGVLVVEDDPAVRRLLARVLEEAGYRVYAAGLPSEARSLWQTERRRISLLITDVLMPGESGRDLARDLRIRAAQSGMPQGLRVLYITGHAPRSTQGSAAADDATLDAPYLPKPFTPDHLLAKVRKTLSHLGA